MRPYGARKCHCNGKASRARDERRGAVIVSEQLDSADEQLLIDTDTPVDNDYFDDWVFDSWANCQCECCNSPGEEEAA